MIISAGSGRPGKTNWLSVRRQGYFMLIVKDRIKIAAAFNKAIKMEKFLLLLFLAAIIMMFQEPILHIAKLQIFMMVPNLLLTWPFIM